MARRHSVPVQCVPVQSHACCHPAEAGVSYCPGAELLVLPYITHAGTTSLAKRIESSRVS